MDHPATLGGTVNAREWMAHFTVIVAAIVVADLILARMNVRHRVLP